MLQHHKILQDLVYLTTPPGNPKKSMWTTIVLSSWAQSWSTTNLLDWAMSFDFKDERRRRLLGCRVIISICSKAGWTLRRQGEGFSLQISSHDHSMNWCFMHQLRSSNKFVKCMTCSWTWSLQTQSNGILKQLSKQSWQLLWLRSG
jgi:hypothetical protein